MTTAVAVEIEEEMDTAQEENSYNAALARWVAGINEDLKALKNGTLKTEPWEDFKARRKEYWRQMKAKNAHSPDPAL